MVMLVVLYCAFPLSAITTTTTTATQLAKRTLPGGSME
jgi:hypothetical protein